MEVLAETVLDDILVRSQRLDLRTPFELNLSLPAVIQDSQAIMSSLEDTDDVRLRGQLLLAQEKADVSRTKDILKGIQIENVKPMKIASFLEQTEETLQSNIVSSISETHDATNEITDDFISKVIVSRWEDEQAKHHISFSQAADQKKGFYIPITQRKAAFFAEHLSKKNNDFAQSLAEDVVDPEQYVDSHSVPLSDSFDLIATMGNNRNNLTKGVLSFLENQKKRIIKDEVNRFLTIAERGGEIGFLQTVIAYIRMHHTQAGEMNAHWAVVYYTLRCGEIKEAIQYVQNNAAEFHSQILTALLIKQKGDTFSPELSFYLSSELSNADVNYFKVAALGAILHRSPGKLSKEVLWSAEDWIWMRLQMPNASISQLGEELSDLTWDTEAQQNPFLVGQIYIICGDFEKACKWFLTQEDNIDENTHIAIALHLSNFVQAKSVSDSILDYAEQVFETDKVAAVRYMSVINEQSEKVRCTALLAVECDNGVDLFLSKQGETPPIQFSLTVEEQKKILYAAGVEAEARDQHTKAAVLFKLAGDYSRIIENECIELRQCIEGYVDSSALQDALDLHREITASGVAVPMERLETMRSLMYLAAAKTMIDETKFGEANNYLDLSELFPQSRSQVSEYVERIRVASKEIRRVYATAIEIAMHGYSELYKFVPKDPAMSSNYDNSGFRSLLKERAAALQEISSIIDIDISQETQYRILTYYNIFR